MKDKQESRVHMLIWQYKIIDHMTNEQIQEIVKRSNNNGYEVEYKIYQPDNPPNDQPNDQPKLPSKDKKYIMSKPHMVKKTQYVMNVYRMFINNGNINGSVTNKMTISAMNMDECLRKCESNLGLPNKSIHFCKGDGYVYMSNNIRVEVVFTDITYPTY